MKRPVFLLAGLFLLPALAISQKEQDKKEQVHKEVRVIVNSDDKSRKQENREVKVMVLRDTLIRISSDHNGQREANVDMQISDEKGIMVIRLDESGAEKKVIKLNLDEMTREMEQLGKEMENMKEEDIQRLMEKYIPRLENMEHITIELDREMKGLEEEMRQLEKEMGNIHIETIRIDGMEGQVDTLVNEVMVSDDGRIVTKTLVVRAVVNVEELTDTELNTIREKNQDKSATTLKVDKLEFYPNPSDGRFTVNFVSPEKGDLNITVTDMNGKQVYAETVPNFQGTYNKQFDLSAVSKGMYILRMNIGNRSHYKKLMID